MSPVVMNFINEALIVHLINPPLIIIFITRFNLQINCGYIFFRYVQFIRDNKI